MPSMFLLFSSFAFFISSIDETPPEINTGKFEVLAIFSVPSKFGLVSFHLY